MEDYDEIILQIEALLAYLEAQQNKNETRDLIPSFELSRLRVNRNVVRQQVTNLKLLLPVSSNCSKRDLINGMGSVLKFPFGTMDDDVYQNLNSKLDN